MMPRWHSSFQTVDATDFSEQVPRGSSSTKVTLVIVRNLWAQVLEFRGIYLCLGAGWSTTQVWALRRDWGAERRGTTYKFWNLEPPWSRSGALVSVWYTGHEEPWETDKAEFSKKKNNNYSNSNWTTPDSTTITSSINSNTGLPQITPKTFTTASPAIATMGSPSGPLRPRASSNFMGIRASGFPPSMTPQEKHLFSTHVNTATTRLSSTMAASETGEGYVFVVYFHKTTAADALALLQAADIRVRGHEIQFSWH
ncbi:hypothetical protein CTAM01_10064 [Colletotrichum tamarilloi]|nr:uncharacterized protein CTAM01_10064 [Colletotrichum tamarilloi]KAK1492007.1 hypothetical protein CTAM01_10064 [Colletotrichum tamarilloi]